MPSVEAEASARDRLIEAAILCFAEKGFDATGIREIAHRARANSALVQYHFGGKTGLYAAALNHVFASRPVWDLRLPERPHQPGAQAQAMAVMGELIQGMLNEIMAASAGAELDQASLRLVTRELQSPRADMAGLILEHLRPYTDVMLGCLGILRPDLERPEALDYLSSILGQVVHLQYNLQLIRLIRGEPDYPRDLQAVARHITQFSLRGLGLPEALPGA